MKALGPVVALVLIFTVPKTQARARIFKEMNRGESMTDETSSAANRVFAGFLACDAKDSGKIQMIAPCAAKFFVKEVSAAQIRRYSEMVIFPDRYSELVDCDRATKRVIKIYEDAKFDAAYCFESNFVRSSDRVGVMFFVKENGELRISKIKL